MRPESPARCCITLAANDRRDVSRSPAAEVGAGPIRFNVALARAYGWTEEEIAEMVAHMTYIERDHAERCAERYPDRFGVADGRRVFTGEIPTTARGTP